MVELRAHEKKLLLTLEKLNGQASVHKLMCESGLPDAAVMRSALVLQEKGLVKIHAAAQTVIKLNPEGKTYAENGLPERQLVNAVVALGGKAPLDCAASEAGLQKKFVQIALGWTQRKKWAVYDSKTNMLAVAVHPEKEADETLLERLSSCPENLPMDQLGEEDKAAAQTLKKRQLLVTSDKTARILDLTEQGRMVVHEDSLVREEVTQLAPDLIISGKWQRVKLQKYNIWAPVARTWPGKKHPYLAFLDEMREKLVNFGFKEMTGTNVETSFFNFDALYTPQDHPARESFGIYFVKNPVHGSLDLYEEAVIRVKATHENGWETGSTGWGYKYSREEAARLILRGHGTCLSARTLLSRDLEIPSRYFSIARCYRPEVVDKTHLSEFNQVEGIVVDPNLNLKDLLGVLEKFAVEIAGADKVRFKPDYFPFTEPSVELSAFKEGYGWVEVGGSGIFRPEVTLPLGVKVPVIAWGLGVDRLFMMRAGIEDIRHIFSQNLDWLRKKEVT